MKDNHIFSWNTLYSKIVDGTGKMLLESVYVLDARGNWTSARITDWIDGEERVQEKTLRSRNGL